MTRVEAIALRGAEFNDFLFAPIGEDRNGMLVSVLSGLARLDVDPWQEAADLAQLPGETATQRLASLIGALRDGDPSYLDPRTISMRLIALLPNRNGTKNQSQNTPHSISATINSRPWWAHVIFMCFVLGAQFMIANKQLPTKADSAQAESSNAVSQQIPPERSGQK
jgi:hypothetical protein